MGMGEPIDNLDEVLRAVEVLTGEAAPGLGRRHVTVSTSGVLPEMKRFLASSRAQLALSLNATTDEQRERLMPHNRTWPIASLLGALREDAAAGSGRRYFVEYVLWRDVNDTDDDARRLAALLADLPAHVNLIPHNAFAGKSAAPPPRPSGCSPSRRSCTTPGCAASSAGRADGTSPPPAGSSRASVRITDNHGTLESGSWLAHPVRASGPPRNGGST